MFSRSIVFLYSKCVGCQPCCDPRETPQEILRWSRHNLLSVKYITVVHSLIQANAMYHKLPRCRKRVTTVPTSKVPQHMHISRCVRISFFARSHCGIKLENPGTTSCAARTMFSISFQLHMHAWHDIWPHLNFSNAKSLKEERVRKITGRT